MVDRLYSIYEVCLLVRFQDLTGRQFAPREVPDTCGFVYVTSAIDSGIVKIGSTNNPYARIGNYNCGSGQLHRMFAWQVDDYEFWEGTILNLLAEHRIQRHYGPSEMVRGIDVLNGIDEIVDRWQPDCEAMAWLWHITSTISTLCGARIGTSYLDNLMWVMGLWGERTLRLALELYNRQVAIIPGCVVTEATDSLHLGPKSGVYIYDRDRKVKNER